MTHTVAVGEFEGPLGILLDLVERRRLEVTSISVAEITAGYLERIRSVEAHSPEELGEFLALGARLLYIKSLALLPSQDEDQNEELRALNLELDEYKLIQAAARELAARADSRTWPRRATERLEPRELPLPTLELPALAEALARALSSAPAQSPPGVIRVTVSQQMIVGRLRHRLPDGFELAEVLRDCSNRLEVVVTFLALLELIREGAAQVAQTAQFGTLTVSAA